MTRKVLTLALTCTALLAGSTVFAQTSPAAKKKTTAKSAVKAAPNSVSAKLIANEKLMIDSITKHDASAFFGLIAPGAMSVDEGGLSAVEDFRKSFDQMKVDGQTATEMKVISLGANTAIVTYKLAQKGTYMGQPLPPNVYATTIWKNKDAKWWAAFHQESTAAKR